MSNQEKCGECNGKGWIELSCLKADEARACSLCNGTGLTTLERPCPGCHGKGLIEVRTVEQQKCLRCDGTGRWPPAERL